MFNVILPVIAQCQSLCSSMFDSDLITSRWLTSLFKGVTIATRAVSKWGGAMIKLWAISLSVVLGILV